MTSLQAISQHANDHTIGWKNLNLLSHPNNATLAPQARQARASGGNLKYLTLVPQARLAKASGENLNYVTLAPQAMPSGEIFNYLLSSYSDILCMIIGRLRDSVIFHETIFRVTDETRHRYVDRHRF